MKSAIFHDEAFAEFNEAVENYESQCTGLGRELRLATDAIVTQIESHPTRWPLYKDTPGSTLSRAALSVCDLLPR